MISLSSKTFSTKIFTEIWIVGQRIGPRNWMKQISKFLLKVRLILYKLMNYRANALFALRINLSNFILHSKVIDTVCKSTIIIIKKHSENTFLKLKNKCTFPDSKSVTWHSSYKWVYAFNWVSFLLEIRSRKPHVTFFYILNMYKI